MPLSLFPHPIKCDYESLLRALRPGGRSNRVHFVELFLDVEVQDEICRRFNLLDGLDPARPDFPHAKELRVQRFLGYDFVKARLTNCDFPINRNTVADTASLSRDGGREFVNLHSGPITSWQEFEKYPWPDPAKASTAAFEYFQKNLPDDMCVVARGVAHYAEYLAWLMGYETLCFAIYDQPDLVQAIYDRFHQIDCKVAEIALQFDRVRIVWGSDDMGHRTGTLIGPEDLRRFVLPGHKRIAQMTHDAGRLYVLHSCGKLDSIMDDLIDDVRIDAKHSYEDTIQPVTDFYKQFAGRVGVIGGIDVDFISRSTPNDVRRRTRQTLEACNNGGYWLGTGNSVTNYIPVDNYLAMLIEGAEFKG